MKGYIVNIEEKTERNKNFREVLFTGPHSQLVVMSLEPDEEIGSEVHMVDQFIRVESGIGTVVLNDEEHEIEDGWAVVVPAGVEHNIINDGDEPMKLYTVYSPGQHADGTVQKTKEEAMAEEEEEEE